MLKKAIPKPSSTSHTEKKQIECSICKNKAHSVPYVCDSGHIICNICQRSDTTIKTSHEGGDFPFKEAFGLDYDIKQLQITKSDDVATDFASGDQNNELAAEGINDKDNKFCIKKTEDFNNTSLIYKDLYLKNVTKTTIEYKNAHFQESKSSVTENIEECSKKTEDNEEDEVDSCNVDPRPVVCPVTVCSKIVTIDSIMLHFLFDHSKVPRTTLEDTTPQEVLLKSANFSTEIQCVATFIMETQTGLSQTLKKKVESTSSVSNSKKGNKLLLLLSVRLPTNSVKLPNVRSDASRIFTRSIHTQTGKMNEPCSEISTEYDSKNGSDYKSCTSKSVLDEDEVLLLWLCKLDDVQRVFTITLLGEDKKRGYCYIGDAAHVRDKQDPSLLYDRSECLIVKGSAIRGLFDNKGLVAALVSIIGSSK